MLYIWCLNCLFPFRKRTIPEIGNNAELLRIIHLPDHPQALQSGTAVGQGALVIQNAVHKMVDLMLGLLARLRVVRVA